MIKDNPYKTPQSELIDEVIPDSFRNSSISPRKLFISGWLSIIVSLISIPILFISFANMEAEDDFLYLISQSFTVISAIIWIYLLLVLWEFIVARFNISGVANYIKLLIFFSIISTALSFFMDQSGGSGEISIVMVTYFLLFIPEGIITILFGKKLLSIDEPYPYLKAFSWLTIVIGICFTTVVLFLLVIPINFVANIVLALLFFNGYKELTN